MVWDLRPEIAMDDGRTSLERRASSMFQFKKGATVENPREYETAAVEQLRNLLESGNPAQRDPRRENFYDIENQFETYYIHVSPISGNVTLLAKWIRQSQECCSNTEQLVA
jgi:hypothetical protein